MGKSDKAKRIAAECSHCGTIYTAQLWSNGEITPIGNPSGCECGGTDFINLNKKTTADPSTTEELGDR